MDIFHSGRVHATQRFTCRAVAVFLLLVFLPSDYATASAEHALQAFDALQQNSVSIRFFKDSTGRRSETDVIHLPEHVWGESRPDGITTFGYSTSAVWCHVRITAPATESVVIELPTTRLDHVHWFLLAGGEPVLLAKNGLLDQGGGGLVQYQYPTVHLPAAPSGRYELYFRVTSDCSLAIPVNVTTAAGLQSMELARYARGHLEIGIAVAIVAVIITLAVLFKDAALALLALCGVFVIGYGISFDTVLSLRGLQIPGWLPRTGCSVFCVLQAVAMLAFAASEAGVRNFSRLDWLLVAAGTAGSLFYIILHIWLPYSALIPWLNAVCIVDSAISVWTISLRYRANRQFHDLVPVMVLMLAHVPGLLLILHFHGFTLRFLSPQSLRMIAIPIVFCGMTFSLLQRRRFADQLKLHAALSQAGEADARLSALRYQLNPHMLMNSLTAISSLSRSCPEQIPALIQNLSSILHARLKPASGFCWTLQREIALVRDIVALEKVRFGGQLEFTLQVAAEALTCTIPEMLLQPLIENSLKYCSSSTDIPELRLEAWLDHGTMRIKVVNSIDSEVSGTPPAGLRIGHANVQERLALIYHGEADFQFAIRDSVAFCELQFPVKPGEFGQQPCDALL